MARIGMVLASAPGSTFPPDIRVEKEATALSRAGHDVFILTRWKPGAAEREFSAAINATIVRVALTETSFLGRPRTELMLVSREWREAILRFVEQNEIEILHAHDLLILPTVLAATKATAIPVVADLHEDMPAAKRAYRANLRPLRRLREAIYNNYLVMRSLERRALKKSEAVIVVVPEAAVHIVGFGIPRDKIHIVSNTEDETTFDRSLTDAPGTKPDVCADRWVASYIGGVGPHRGIDTLLRAAPIVKEAAPDILILIVGASPNAQKQIEGEIKKNLLENIVVLGWQPPHLARAYMARSDIGVVPHNRFEHTDNTVPHKLFQYFMCGKPVVVSDCKPLSRIMNDTRAGDVFVAGDERTLAAAIVRMRQDKAAYDAASKRAETVFHGQYGWHEDAARLIRLYADLFANGDTATRKGASL